MNKSDLGFNKNNRSRIDGASQFSAGAYSGNNGIHYNRKSKMLQGFNVNQNAMKATKPMSVIS